MVPRLPEVFFKDLTETGNDKPRIKKAGLCHQG